MSKIFIIRHGQDTDNAENILNGHRDTELTDLGCEQACEMGNKLKNENIQVIYTSPLKRAQKTASIIGDVLKINKIVICNELIERDFGILTGKSNSDISKYAGNIIVSDGVQYFTEADEAETFLALFERARQVLEKITENQSNRNILIVTHGDTGKMLRAVFNGWTWEQGLKTPRFRHGDIIELCDE